MDIKVSVVVPVYNVEKYLEQCLDSIINQTLKEMEIICVNDGSTDNCGAILDDYAKKDSRIIVIHKENSGYGHTMNVGFDKALGDYIGIVESDDFIAPNMYEVLYNKAYENNLDFAKCNRFSLYDNKNGTMNMSAEPLLLPPTDYNKIINFKTASLSKCIKFEEFKWIWCGLYNKDFIKNNKIRFHETSGASYQDTSFHFITMMLADKIMLLPEPMHYYRKNNLNSSSNSEALIDVLFKEYDYIINYMKEHNLLTDNMQSFADYCCINNCELQFPRLGINYVKPFVELIKDYMISRNILPCSDKIYNIYYNTDTFIAQQIKEKELKEITINKYLNKLENSRSIIVYGAGICGDYIYHTLGHLGFLHKVDCYAVTNIQDDNDKFYDITIRSIDDVKNKDSLIIVAGKYTNLLEMHQTVQKMGFENVATMLEFV